jgi:carboxymethylenebutenolidase
MTQVVQEEQLKGAGGMPVVVFEPEAPGRYPSVLIMPERYGLVRHIVENAQKLSTHGFVVGAPDLMYDHPDQDGLHAGSVDYKPSDEVILKRAEEAVALLASREKADVSRLGMVGICQSGRYPFIWGAAHPIQAAVVFYGATHAAEWKITPIHPCGIDGLLAQMKRTNVLGVFGEDDHVISTSDVLRFRNELEKHNHSYQISMYPGVPHGWLNDTMPGRYRPEAAAQAWNELLEFLREKLASKADTTAVEWLFRSTTSTDYDFSKKVRYE